MHRLNRIRVCKVGNSPRDPHDAPMGPRRQPELCQRLLQELPGWNVQDTLALQEARLQLGIRMDPVLTVPVALPVPGSQDARADSGGIFRHGPLVVEVADGDRRHLDMHVDPVLQRPGQFRPIAADLLRAAEAFMSAIPIVAAGA